MSTIQDVKLSTSAKGKAKEDNHWQLGWWDLCHLMEGTRRPIAWSKSSVIFTSHPSQPRVEARHFPSNRQFGIPSPAPFASSPISYESPTVISVCPTDDWLFAYFPGRGCDGAGCLWKRGPELDSWVVEEWWSFPTGAGVVAADWTCAHREWVVYSGSSIRLPPRGPLAPGASPILFLVTQSHQINICFLPPFASRLEIMRGSLLQSSDTSEAQPDHDNDTLTALCGSSFCTHAAIGLSYNESSILVAMRSHLLPPHNPSHSNYNSTDLDLPLDVMHYSLYPENLLSPEWELWGEESIIHLCEVRLNFKAIPSLATKPLQPISYASPHLTDLIFVSKPPTYNSNSPRKDSGKGPDGTGFPKGNLYLIACFVDFKKFTSMPDSEIASFSFATMDGAASPSVSTWHVRAECKDTFQNKVLDFVTPYISSNTLLAGFLDASGTIPPAKRKIQETVIGKITVLKLSDLRMDEGWEDCLLLSNVDSAGRDVPVNVVLSPNHSLLCSVSSPTLLNTHISVRSLPRRRIMSTPAPNIPTEQSSDITRQLVSAIRSRTAPSDVIKSLTMPTIPFGIVTNTLYNAFSLLSIESCGHYEMWTGDMLGIASEIFLARSRRMKDEAEKDNILQRWKVAHDISSLSACCSAFEGCREGQAYDLDAVWQLVGLSSWFIKFVEALLQECILIGDGIAVRSSTLDASSPYSAQDHEARDDSVPCHPNVPVPSVDSPSLFHLIHPYALNRVHTALGHVKRFRDHVATLSAKGEREQIAKDALLDVVDCSGVDLEGLGQLLDDMTQDVKAFDVVHLQMCLVTCSPAPSFRPYLYRAIDKILTSGVIHRPRLFLKPADLTDGVSRLSLTDQHNREKDRDVVSKGLLLNHMLEVICVRCGGKSEVGRKEGYIKDISVQWCAWEKTWAWLCVCGGSWVRTSRR
ncbi:hypothetical protein AcV5_005998 [Taiwanofungus camphoratus]|nr:hypothetical protein AcW2_004436 [Antrodia cinnamomea]KAI0933117.1 hypothetical protein AcV7_004684 [Antrodia cinnamomea]KAI0933118.1 hypothetical protein AcV7_004684 [Antrodia cinnamomea]KAI0934010.1 hypothetical protein AcV5_005998 [Antrodia cinnamomea]